MVKCGFCCLILRSAREMKKRQVATYLIFTNQISR